MVAGQSDFKKPQPNKLQFLAPSTNHWSVSVTIVLRLVLIGVYSTGQCFTEFSH